MRSTIDGSLPTRSRFRSTAALAAALLLALGLAACSDDSGGDVTAGSSGTTATTAASDQSTTTVAPASGDGYSPGGGGGGASAAGTTIVAKDFSLTSISAAPGAEIEVENEGAKPHTVTADDASFDTDRVEPGAQATFTAPSQPGQYTYHCEIHPAMTGTLTVEG
jgi:plastocyanin